MRDLLGPWAGDAEELPAGTVPSERYILGVLSPARVSLDAEITDATASDDGSGEGAAEVTAAAAAGSMAPASLGLSFSLPMEVSSVRVRASWGRYVQGESATEVTDAGVPRLVWQRVNAGGSVDLDVTEPESTEVPDPEQPGVVVRARCRPQGKCRVVDVAIVNAQPEPPDRKDAAKIFQVRVEVTALDGNEAVFLPHNDPSHIVADDTTPMTDLEMQGLAMLYRQARQFAVGRNAGVDVDRRTVDGCAWRVATTNMPAYEVEQTVAPDPAQVPQLAGLEVDMRTLATAPRADVVAALRPLTDGYLDWLDQQDKRLASDPTLTAHGVAARSHLKAAREAAARIAAGIDLLATDENAWRAWQFANLAMAMQREHTEIAVERAKNPTSHSPRPLPWSTSHGGGLAAFSARVCAAGSPLADRSGHPDRALASATNGPGLADCFLPHRRRENRGIPGSDRVHSRERRLQGLIGEGSDARDGRAGVAVLMRYTLRLLTAQQFQRAATLICAAEQLRLSAAVAQRAGGPLNPWVRNLSGSDYGSGPRSPRTGTSRPNRHWMRCATGMRVRGPPTRSRCWSARGVGGISNPDRTPNATTSAAEYWCGAATRTGYARSPANSPTPGARASLSPWSMRRCSGSPVPGDRNRRQVRATPAAGADRAAVRADVVVV